jgi:transcriptional regulator with GAF, ATPase, and Fis domain
MTGENGMNTPDGMSHKLHSLKTRLEQVSHSWTVNDYEALLKFYVGIIPKIIDAERCSIFFVEPGTEKIWLKFGTGLKEQEIRPPKKGSVVGDAIASGKCVTINGLDKQSGYHTETAKRTKFVVHNLICAPIKSLTDQGITGAIQVLNKHGGKQFSRKDEELVQEVANYLSMAIENILLNQEILKISDQLNRKLGQIWKEDIEFIAESRVMQNILDTVRSVSKTPVNVLIQGESGSGKEVIARMIHSGGERSDKPFVSVNCASIPENLMESEFFGYEKGAFTGAVSSRKGRFEEADGGTLFLDEIADMPMGIQPKFLRAIQEGEGSRLGSNKSVQYDLRLISATNMDLNKAVEDGQFRKDLFYRIFSVEIHIPPLRDRREDIVPLATLFLSKVSKRFKKKNAGFPTEVLNFFEGYEWPGNVRQLLHEVERLVALTPEGKPLSMSHFSQELKEWKNTSSVGNFISKAGHTLPSKVKELEIGCIKDALDENKWNKLQAAKFLGITRQGLDKKLKRYNISK